MTPPPIPPVASSLAHELEVLIRARYPVIYVHTAEEARALGLIEEIAARRGKRVFEWSVSTGLIPGGTHLESARARQPLTRDPVAALDAVIDHLDPAVFVFKDLHPFLARLGSTANAATIRKLREVALHLKQSFKTVVLISPVLEIPPELEKEVVVLDLPLPTRMDLGKLLDRIADELRTLQQMEVSLDRAGQSRLAQAALGLTLGEAENVFARILVQGGHLDGDAVGEVLAEKRQIIRKSGLLEYTAAAETFADLGGLTALKSWLDQRAEAFTDEARAFGLAAPRGVLLLGVQGCGKSLCAKAVSVRWQLPLLRFDMGRVFGGLIGSSEENVRRAIAVAESVAPAVLWVDEIDKAFAGSQSSGATDGGTTARVLGTFLTWLSEKTAPVFVVATANDITQLPPELLRKGRLDEIFFVDLPAARERAEILSVHLRKRGRDPAGFDLNPLAAASEDFSGAEIEEVVNSALYDAFHSRTELTGEHLLAAIQRTVPLARTMDESISRLRRWAVGRARPAGEAETDLRSGP